MTSYYERIAPTIRKIDDTIVTPIVNKLNASYGTTVLGIFADVFVVYAIKESKYDREIGELFLVGTAIATPIAMKFTNCPYERGFLFGFGLLQQIVMGEMIYYAVVDKIKTSIS